MNQMALLILDGLIRQARALRHDRWHVQPSAELLEAGHFHRGSEFAHWIT